MNSQPVFDRLANYSEAAECKEKWCCDKIGYFYYKSKWGGCDINLGRRFMIESPDKMLLRYNETRVKKAPTSILDSMYIQYLQTEYQNDELSLMMETKLFKVEPWVHYDISQMTGLNVPVMDYYRKLYFPVWRQTLSDDDIKIKSVQELNDMLTKYVLSLDIDPDDTMNAVMGGKSEGNSEGGETEEESNTSHEQKEDKNYGREAKKQAPTRNRATAK
jgi:hypothetical protein